MAMFKPRSKKAFLRAMKGLKISSESKDILANIGVEMDGAAHDAITEIRSDVLATLLLVESELIEHDTEYHHISSPEVKEAVRKAILKLGGKPRGGSK